jgi:hypothetical protein
MNAPAAERGYQVFITMGDKVSASEKRKHARYASSAVIQIGGQRYSLKDISVSGCCLRLPAGADSLELSREYTATIIAEPDAQAASFDLTVEPCWAQDKEDAHEVGCFITGFPEGKQYQLFADYLAWRISRI